VISGKAHSRLRLGERDQEQLEIFDALASVYQGEGVLRTDG